MDIKQLRTFLAVADARSFFKAADDMYISRQAISKTILQLEAELGVELFSRSQKGAMMTPAGIFFYPRAATLVAEFDKLKDETMDIQRSYRPKLNVCMALGIYSYFAGPLAEYGKRHRAEMEILCRGCLDADCGTVLSDRRADAVLSFTPQSDNIAQTSVLTSSPIVFLAADTLEIPERKSSATLLPLLLYTGGHAKPLWWQKSIGPNDIISSDLGHLFSLLCESGGVMPIPKIAIPSYLKNVRVLPAPKLAPSRIYYANLYPDHYNAITFSLLDAIHQDVFSMPLPDTP